MADKVENSIRNIHYVQINETLCNGCVLCMKECPTKAIRVRDDLAHIEGVCIDCGECIRVCPRGAIKAITSRNENIDRSRAIVSVSPVLYSQFNKDITPDEVFLALKDMGFLDVNDQCEYMEMFNVAAEIYTEYLKKKGKESDVPRPIISHICPVVVRIIAYRFPSLMKHFPPTMPPREFSAREAKRKAAKNREIDEKNIRVYHITPCSAKMIAIKSPLLIEKSYLDGAIGINAIYQEIVQNLKSKDRKKGCDNAGGIGIGWGRSGGEVAAMEEGNFLAVSGIKETISYLEKIEMGLLNDIDYIEFRTCTEGCIGGPLTVKDSYQAKYSIQRLGRKFGFDNRVDFDYIKNLYNTGWFFAPTKINPSEIGQSGLSISEAIGRQEKVERVHQLLPLKECGVCGAPDCRTFAEDVVDGRASIECCIFQEIIGKKEGRDESI